MGLEQDGLAADRTGDRFQHLFSAIQVGSLTLRNRAIQASLTSLFSQGGAVTPQMIDFYSVRARGGMAAIVSEALVADHSAPVPTRVHAYRERNLEGLKRWADAVEGADCRLFGQLSHPGRGRNVPGRFCAVGPSWLPDDLSWTVPRMLARSDLRLLVEEFAETAERLKRAGFSGVELSCAHGHLFHQFMSPHSNEREDEYGGNEDGRLRLVLDICAAIRGGCGSGFAIGIKLPGDDGVPGGIGPVLAREIGARLARQKAGDYLAVAQGSHHRSLEMHVPDRTYADIPYRELSRRLKAVAMGCPVATVGRIAQPAEAEQILRSGDGDLVMVGRATLADPQWLEKARQDRVDDIVPCIACNTCWGEIVARRPLACDVNPRLGTPDEAQPLARTRSRRRIVVIGAGVAGLEAACIAASRGHRVTVFSASQQLGGKARLQAALPGGRTLERYIAHQERAALASGVTFERGWTACAQDLVALDPHMVIVATGARMAAPRIDADIDLGAADLRSVSRRLVDRGPPQLSARAVVYDCDHTDGTYDAVNLIAGMFNETVLVTPREGVAADVSLVTRQRIQRQLAERGVRVVNFAEVDSVLGGKVTTRNVFTGSLHTLDDVSLFTYATARRPNDLFVQEPPSLAMEIHLIGDCKMPRSLLEAVGDGFAVGSTA